MKRIILAAAVLASTFAFSASDASAFVCARGPYRAGCVGPNGAVGVRRGFYGGYRGAYVGRSVGVYRGGFGRVGYGRVGGFRRF